METSEITAAFLQALGRWSGCHWATRFGRRQLNLQGLKSSQAALMARSTAGPEAAEWRAAAKWLEQVERDAKEAEKQAGLAATLVVLGQFGQAWEHAQRASALESQYDGSHAWQPLSDAIRAALKHSEAVRFQPAERNSSAAMSVLSHS
jgi:hypothetical protein